MNQDPNTGKFLPGNNLGTTSKKSATIGRYIRSKVGDDYKVLVDKLIDILNNSKCTPANRMKAIEILLDRSLGKPAIFANVNLDTDIVIGLPEDLNEKDF